MRLIDADALKIGLDDKASYESIRKMIDNQPTISTPYRTFNSLTDDEIRFAMNDIFTPLKIGEIHHVNEDLITVDIFIMPDYPDISDTIEMTEMDLETHDFDLTEESFRWKQFLISKGINSLFKDNPYLANEKTQLSHEEKDQEAEEPEL